MNKFILKLLLLAKNYPDGLTIALPDGSLLQVEWLTGLAIEEQSDGLKFKQAFGCILKGDFGEVTIPIYVA